MSRDVRDERIAELEAENAALRQALAKMEERVRALEARLGQNSSNSSKPPSSDSPAERGSREKPKGSGRKAGGQPGHEPHRRQLLPPEEVTRTDEHFPPECAGCGAHLAPVQDADALRHQVLELPAIVPEVVEHLLHAVECDECGHCTRAALPLGVARGFLGPRVLALLGLLTGSFRVSRRNAATLLSDVLGLPISLGALSEAEQRISEAVAPAVEEAIAFVQAQPVKHIDATSWAQCGKARTLWTLCTTLVTVFAITLDATRPTVRKLLGKIRGTLVSDRATAFLYWTMGQRQICWAHLLRKFAGFAEKRASIPVPLRSVTMTPEQQALRDLYVQHREVQRVGQDHDNSSPHPRRAVASHAVVRAPYTGGVAVLKRKQPRELGDRHRDRDGLRRRPEDRTC